MFSKYYKRGILILHSIMYLLFATTVIFSHAEIKNNFKVEEMKDDPHGVLRRSYAFALIAHVIATLYSVYINDTRMQTILILAILPYHIGSGIVGYLSSLNNLIISHSVIFALLISTFYI